MQNETVLNILRELADKKEINLVYVLSQVANDPMVDTVAVLTTVMECSIQGQPNKGFNDLEIRALRAMTLTHGLVPAVRAVRVGYEAVSGSPMGLKDAKDFVEKYFGNELVEYRSGLGQDQ